MNLPLDQICARISISRSVDQAAAMRTPEPYDTDKPRLVLTCYTRVDDMRCAVDLSQMCLESAAIAIVRQDAEAGRSVVLARIQTIAKEVHWFSTFDEKQTPAGAPVPCQQAFHGTPIDTLCGDASHLGFDRSERSGRASKVSPPHRRCHLRSDPLASVLVPGISYFIPRARSFSVAS